VVAGDLENAFCAVRPPGHHACRDKAMGFCFFNNVAIAAKYALERHDSQALEMISNNFRRYCQFDERKHRWSYRLVVEKPVGLLLEALDRAYLFASAATTLRSFLAGKSRSLYLAYQIDSTANFVDLRQSVDFLVKRYGEPFPLLKSEICCVNLATDAPFIVTQPGVMTLMRCLQLAEQYRCGKVGNVIHSNLVLRNYLLNCGSCDREVRAAATYCLAVMMAFHLGGVKYAKAVHQPYTGHVAFQVYEYLPRLAELTKSCCAEERNRILGMFLGQNLTHFYPNDALKALLLLTLEANHPSLAEHYDALYLWSGRLESADRSPRALVELRQRSDRAPSHSLLYKVLLTPGVLPDHLVLQYLKKFSLKGRIQSMNGGTRQFTDGLLASLGKPVQLTDYWSLEDHMHFNQELPEYADAARQAYYTARTGQTFFAPSENVPARCSAEQQDRLIELCFSLEWQAGGQTLSCNSPRSSLLYIPLLLENYVVVCEPVAAEPGFFFENTFGILSNPEENVHFQSRQAEYITSAEDTALLSETRLWDFLAELPLQWTPSRRVTDRGDYLQCILALQSNS